MKAQSVTLTEEQAEQNIMGRIEKYEQNFLDGGAEVINRDIEKNSDKNGVTVTVTYTLEGEIGEEKMIFAKYEPPKEPEKESDEKKEN